MRTLLILLLLTGTVWAKENCKTPLLSYDGNVAYQVCRNANENERIANALERIENALNQKALKHGE